MGEELRKVRHVAIIMDGNGRWAKERHLPRQLGHKKGCEVLEQTVRDASDLGIDYLTVYAFSTENWKRSMEEVGALMKLFVYYMKKLLVIAMENNVRVRMIGEKSRFSDEIIRGMDRLTEETAGNTGMVFTIAVNYGARDELRRAFLRMSSDMKEGKLHEEEITEEKISSYLDTAGLPDPDLLIRTGGDLRVSNFLLWQIAYAELYVTDSYWPDFNKEELKKALLSFGKRERRFGARPGEEGA